MPESVYSSVWQTPVALISTMTSPLRGPSSWTVVTSSGLPASNATAARTSMVVLPLEGSSRASPRQGRTITNALPARAGLHTHDPRARLRLRRQRMRWTSIFFMTSKARGDFPQIRSFVRPRRRRSSVPTAHLAAAARRGGQGWPRLARPPQGLALIGPSTAARSAGSGLERPRGLAATSALRRDWN